MVAFDEETAHRVYEKSGGRCVYCTKQLARGNRGRRGERGAWHIDHRRSQANGGTHHLNNLSAACIDCNEDKSSRNAASYQRASRHQEDDGIPWGGIVVAGGLLLLLAALGARTPRAFPPPPPWDAGRAWP
jgi:hypothetical protein